MGLWRRWRTAAGQTRSIDSPSAAFDLPVVGLAEVVSAAAAPAVGAEQAIRFPPHLLERFDPLHARLRPDGVVSGAASASGAIAGATPGRVSEAMSGPVASRDARGRQHEDEWAMPLAELVALATVCAGARPRRIFEIGTYTGIATLILAMNAPDDAEVITLDLNPAARRDHVHGLGIGGFPDFTVGAHLRGQPAAAKVRQCFGDSRTFDFAPFRRSIDLVLIDADHTYEFVARDTAQALAMLRPGGLVVWDDYVWSPQFPECAGVTRCVNELARTRPVRRIAGTRLAVLVDGRDERDERPDRDGRDGT